MKKILAENLINGVLDELKRNKKPYNKIFPSVYFGDYSEKINAVLKANAPNGTVAFCVGEKTLLSFGEKVIEGVKKTGIKISQSVLPLDSDYTIEKASELFAFPEDTRAVLTFDKELLPYAVYFASVKKIPLVFVTLDGDFYDAMPSKVFIKNGEFTEEIPVLYKPIIIVDFNIIEDKKHIIYAKNLSAILTLIDYKIFSILNDKGIYKVFYDVMKIAITKTYSAFSATVQDRLSILVACSFALQAVDYFSNGEILFNSSFYSALRLEEKGILNSEMYTLFGLINLYGVWESSESDKILEVPDYNERADFINRKLSIKISDVLEGMVKTAGLSKDKILACLEGVKGDILELNKFESKVKSTYFAFGGSKLIEDKKEEILTAIKYSGDIPKALNGVTLIRNAGLTEFIK